MKKQDDWKKERDERLARVGLQGEPPKGDGDCIHCGRPFFSYKSTGGQYGMCQDCVDD